MTALSTFVIRHSVPLATVLATFACGGSLSQANETHFAAYIATQDPHPQIVYGDAIQAGTQLTVQLAPSSSHDASHPGEPLIAIVVSPLVDPGGRVIVPSGAQVTWQAGREPGERVQSAQLRVGGVAQPIAARVIARQDSRSRRALTLELERPIPLALLRRERSGESGGAYGGGPVRR